MNFKKFISGVSAFAIAASAFAGMAVTANAAVGDKTNLATVDFNNGTTGADTTLSTNADGRLVIGKGSAAVTVDDSKIGATDAVEVQFKLAFGKLVNRNVYFNMKDADGNEIASFTFNPYGGSLENTLGIVTNDMYYANNTVIWDRNVQFDIKVDYFTGKITTKTSCLKSGAGKDATNAEHVTDLPNGVGALKTFTVGSNYDNEGRMCQIDDIVIDDIEGEDAQPVAYSFDFYNGETLVCSESGTAAVGATVSATTPFKHDGVKYYLADGATASITLSSDAAANIVKVPVRVANNYNVSINAVGDIEQAIVTDTAVEGESYSYAIPQYIVADGVAYEADTLSSSSYYATTVNDVQADISRDVTYTKKYENVVVADDLDGSNDKSAGIRASKGSARNNAAYTSPALDAGTYVAVVRFAPVGRGSVLKLGDETILNAADEDTFAKNAWATATTAEFTVEDGATLSWAAGGSNTYDPIDTVIIYKVTPATPDPSAEVTNTDATTYSGAEYDGEATSALVTVEYANMLLDKQITLTYNGTTKDVEGAKGFTGSSSIVVGVVIENEAVSNPVFIAGVK